MCAFSIVLAAYEYESFFWCFGESVLARTPCTFILCACCRVYHTRHWTSPLYFFNKRRQGEVDTFTICVLRILL